MPAPKVTQQSFFKQLEEMNALYASMTPDERQDAVRQLLEEHRDDPQAAIDKIEALLDTMRAVQMRAEFIAAKHGGFDLWEARERLVQMIATRRGLA